MQSFVVLHILILISQRKKIKIHLRRIKFQLEKKEKVGAKRRDSNPRPLVPQTSALTN